MDLQVFYTIFANLHVFHVVAEHHARHNDVEYDFMFSQSWAVSRRMRVTVACTCT
jgi:hypothetical protein